MILALDIIDSPVSLLVSRRSISRARAKLDFTKNILEIADSIQIATELSPGGHVLLPIRPVSFHLVKTSTSSVIPDVSGVGISDE